MYWTGPAIALGDVLVPQSPRATKAFRVISVCPPYRPSKAQLIVGVDPFPMSAVSDTDRQHNILRITKPPRSLSPLL